MKKLLTLAIICISTFAFAQDRKSGTSDFSQDQRTELQTKKMVLALDLTDAQYQKIVTLKKSQKNKLQKLDKEAYQNLTADEKFERKNDMLDAQISYQREMKKILSDSQYDQWKKMRHKKGKEMKHKKQMHKKRMHQKPNH